MTSGELSFQNTAVGRKYPMNGCMCNIDKTFDINDFAVSVLFLMLTHVLLLHG